MLQRLRNFDLLRADKDEMIELLTWANLYSATFRETGFEVPLWLTARQRDIRRALQMRKSDELAAALAQAKLKRQKTATVEERRAAADDEILRLETEIANLTGG